MPRRKRNSSPFDSFDDDFDEDASSQSSKNGNPPIQRNAANARERARMRVLSSAFGRLKTKLPNIPADTKLSKLDTLRLATMYIKQLKTLAEGGASNREVHHEATGIFSVQGIPQNMTWPFGFHNMQSNSNNNNARLPTTPLQYSPTEWNHTRDNSYQKYGRGSTCNSNGNCSSSSNCNNCITQDSINLPQSHHWYAQDPDDQHMTEGEVGVGNSCAFFESQTGHRHRQNHVMLQMNHQLYQTSHTNTQSSILR